MKSLLRKLITWLFPSQVTERKAVICAEKKDRIIALANELCEAIQEDGKSFSHPKIKEGFGNFDIWIHDFGEPESVIAVSSVINHWKYEGKPTFSEMVNPL